MVSFCVQNGHSPYRYVTVEGTVTSILEQPSVEQMVAIARRYLPEPDAVGFAESELARPDRALALFVVRPDRWLSFDFGA